MGKQAKEFEKARLRALYQAKWKGTVKAFADKVRTVCEEMDIDVPDSFNEKHADQWVTGKKYPEKYLPAVCQVLGISMKDLSPSSRDEKYQYDRAYHDEIDIFQREIAEGKFGLNLKLLEGLKELINFDELFPVYTPIIQDQADQTEGYQYGWKYERQGTATSAEGTGGRTLFQVKQNGQLINLTQYDMKYLKALQFWIIERVKEHFEHHKQELSDATRTAYLTPHTGRDMFLEELEGGIHYTKFKPEQLQKIDPWGCYTNRERKRYGLSITTEIEDDNNGEH